MNRETVRLKPNDLVVVYSDGVTEANNSEARNSGAKALWRRSRTAWPEARGDAGALLDAVRKFSQAAPQADDITVLILRYRGGSADPPHEP